MSQKEAITNRIHIQECKIKRLRKRLQRATSPLKRDRFVTRIKAARARLLALKLGQP